MPSKKQRELKANSGEIKNIIRTFLAFGLDREEFLAKAREKHSEEEVQLLDSEYDSHREILALEPDNLSYFNSVQALMDQHKGIRYDVYMPVVNVLQIWTHKDVAVMTVKALGNFQLFIGGEIQNFEKGYKYVLPVQGMFRSIPYVIGNRETKEILTKQTQFEKIEIETEKIIEKTKIITQEKKTGIDKKKLDKAIAKTKHEMYKKWQPSAVDAVIDNLISNL